MKYVMEFEDYRNNTNLEGNVNLESPFLDNLSIGYDGGRLSININGQEVFATMAAGDDFIFELTNKNEG